MSDPVRIAFATEGSTDFIVLGAAVRALLNGREFVATPVQPELSEAFMQQSGGGWTGLYKWCRQIHEQAGGSIRDNALFLAHDLLVLQVDADVAGRSYSDDRSIQDPPNDLPCEQRCPPAEATTNALRLVVLRWLGESLTPPKVVLCTPSKSLETWVLVALFPQDITCRKPDVECVREPGKRLASKPIKRRLIRGSHKHPEKYREFEEEISLAWPRVRSKCTEADRFSLDLISSLGPDAS